MIAFKQNSFPILTTTTTTTTDDDDYDNGYHNKSISVQTSNNRDYNILIGDNGRDGGGGGLTASTAETSVCHSQYTTTSIEYTTTASQCQQHSEVYRNYISAPHHFLLILFLIIYVLLILLGASVFSLFEQKTEFQLRDQLLRSQQLFLAQNPSVNVESLDQFIEVVIKSYDNGINLHQLNQMLKLKDQLPKTQEPQQQRQQQENDKSWTTSQTNYRNSDRSYGKDFIKKDSNNNNNKKTNKAVVNHKKQTQEEESADSVQEVIAFSIPTEYSNWEFTSSLMFVTSVVTTIGYGHVTPITPEGKLFCLIFSCVAIPFTLVFLSIIVSLLKNGPIRIFEKWLIKSILRHFHQTPDFFIRLLHVVIVTVILLLLIIVLPALLYHYMEKDWTFLDSVYYCYISLTTVGLGDLVPGVGDFSQYESLQLYRICTIFYLYSGLAMIMLWIAVILRIPQLNLKPLLLTEKEDIEESIKINDYNKGYNKPNNYGTADGTHQ
ncbi:uncharacterized protein LOC128957717 [Oppia nitens]|uniref:uncharacterized protein LOC128957717 n=1 Tax=Oppia nitens TaxID=1686743 RepID=UPI0023DA177F|nr:uncharacterized protein LOC128957717 [Oppia nitens]